jgi:hypothetical protein
MDFGGIVTVMVGSFWLSKRDRVTRIEAPSSSRAHQRNPQTLSFKLRSARRERIRIGSALQVSPAAQQTRLGATPRQPLLSANLITKAGFDGSGEVRLALA